MVGPPAPGRLALLAALALSSCAPRATVRPAGNGQVVFAWNGEAEAAWVSGTMTGWKRIPLLRGGGHLEVTLAVHPGRHEYRLEVLEKTGIRIVLPPGVEQVEDGFGGENAVLRMGGP
ncbi:MAG TPA: hypothetical protein VFI16_06675 [Anaeromyxobacteraceae bacterium]|nr:hypothetical protein [Anaeromyxobacteraceae bacterium]